MLIHVLPWYQKGAGDRTAQSRLSYSFLITLHVTASHMAHCTCTIFWLHSYHAHVHILINIFYTNVVIKTYTCMV